MRPKKTSHKINQTMHLTAKTSRTILFAVPKTRPCHIKRDISIEISDIQNLETKNTKAQFQYTQVNKYSSPSQAQVYYFHVLYSSNGLVDFHSSLMVNTNYKSIYPVQMFYVYGQCN